MVNATGFGDLTVKTIMGGGSYITTRGVLELVDEGTYIHHLVKISN